MTTCVSLDGRCACLRRKEGVIQLSERVEEPGWLVCYRTLGPGCCLEKLTQAARPTSVRAARREPPPKVPREDGHGLSLRAVRWSLAGGSNEMEIRDECETGWPSGVSLEQRVAAYTRDDRLRNYKLHHRVKAKVLGARLRGYKVGITASPRTRAVQYGTQYDEMILVYRTSSTDHVTELERVLTKYFTNADNEINGDGGRPAAGGPYYLYVLFVDKP